MQIVSGNSDVRGKDELPARRRNAGRQSNGRRRQIIIPGSIESIVSIDFAKGGSRSCNASRRGGGRSHTVSVVGPGRRTRNRANGVLVRRVGIGGGRSGVDNRHLTREVQAFVGGETHDVVVDDNDDVDVDNRKSELEWESLLMELM